MYEENEGWSDYGMGDGGRAIASSGMGALAYVPDVQPVGSGSGGTYYPRDTTQDARALNYLGFLPDPALAIHVGTLGSQAADMRAEAGAWNPDFQQAVRDFQAYARIGVDGWIGPGTRTAIAAKVAAKNAGQITPPSPGPLPPMPGPTPNLQPVKTTEESSTGLYVGIVLAAAVALGVGWFVFKD